MTTMILSPIKRCYTSPNLKKRRTVSMLTNRYLSSSSILMRKQGNLPDLVSDIFIEQEHRRETIIHIATILRKVGDQIDEQLQTNDNLLPASDHIGGQRTSTLITCLSHVLRFFL